MVLIGIKKLQISYITQLILTGLSGLDLQTGDLRGDKASALPGDASSALLGDPTGVTLLQAFSASALYPHFLLPFLRFIAADSGLGQGLEVCGENEFAARAVLAS